jgi:hypothetical protein
MGDERTLVKLEMRLQRSWRLAILHTFNGEIMGSTLKRPATFRFNVPISSPDRD